MDDAERERGAELVGDGNKVEMLVAICALVASAMAVFMAWDQSRVMRAQQHGAVFPVLQVDGFVSTTPETAQMGVRVSNSGVGPALIEDVKLFRGDEELSGFDAYRARLPDGADISWTGLAGRALAPGEEIEPLRIAWERDAIPAAILNDTAKEWGSLSVVICYCSVFDRCWLTRGVGTSRADRVEACPAGESDIFAAFGTPLPAAETPNPEEAN